MKILNLTGKGKNIGHAKASPEHMPDAKVLELLDQAVGDGYAGIRYNWAFDSMFPDPNKPGDLSRLVFLTNELNARSLFNWPVHGAGPFPNQAGWVAISQNPTWHGCLPPATLWHRIAELASQAILQGIFLPLVEEGANPRQVAAWGCGNEHGDGGVGDPTRTDYTHVKNGTGKMLPLMAEHLKYLATHVNTLGMPMIGSGLECQHPTEGAEIADAIDDYWARFDIIDVHCYLDIPVAKGEHPADAVVRKWDSLSAYLELMGVTQPVWIGETGAKNVEPRQVMDALLGHGAGAVGWYPS